jgi:hypothetical protein
LAGCYAENGDFFEQKKTKAAKHPIQIAHPEKQSLFSSFPSVKAVWRNHYGATEKQIRPPIFHQRAETCLTFRVLI